MQDPLPILVDRKRFLQQFWMQKNNDCITLNCDKAYQHPQVLPTFGEALLLGSASQTSATLTFCEAPDLDICLNSIAGKDYFQRSTQTQGKEKDCKC